MGCVNADEFNVKWNNFQNNILSSYKSLRRNVPFHDITLICHNDNNSQQQHQTNTSSNSRSQFTSLKAHKWVLSSSSTFFHDLFSTQELTATVSNTSSQCISAIYMNEISSTTLEYILDFIYCGEVSVRQGDLDAFISVAKRLRIKGVTKWESGQPNSQSSMESKGENEGHTFGMNGLKQSTFIDCKEEWAGKSIPSAYPNVCEETITSLAVEESLDEIGELHDHTEDDVDFELHEEEMQNGDNEITFDDYKFCDWGKGKNSFESDSVKEDQKRKKAKKDGSSTKAPVYKKHSEEDKITIQICSENGGHWKSLAKKLGIAESTARKWVKAGRFSEKKKRGGSKKGKMKFKNTPHHE